MPDPGFVIAEVSATVAPTVGGGVSLTTSSGRTHLVWSPAAARTVGRALLAVADEVDRAAASARGGDHG
ncbi:MAG: hypothetical protein ACK53W_12465 [Gemmatimonadota bacterium]